MSPCFTIHSDMVVILVIRPSLSRSTKVVCFLLRIMCATSINDNTPTVHAYTMIVPSYEVGLSDIDIFISSQNYKTIMGVMLSFLQSLTAIVLGVVGGFVLVAIIEWMNGVYANKCPRCGEPVSYLSRSCSHCHTALRWGTSQ